MELRRFIWKCVLLAIPFALFTLFIVVVDPYEQVAISTFVPKAEKERNLYVHEDRMVFSTALWRVNRFKSDPKPNVIIGDSRLTRFPESYLDSITGKSYFNFGITGGNFHSLIDAFWLADSLVELESVYLQTSYRIFSKQADWDVLDSPVKVSRSTIKYLTDKRVIASALDLVRPSYKPSEKSLRENDWERKMEQEKDLLATHQLDLTILDKLRLIADHCRANNIELTFLEFPSHQEVVKLYETPPHASRRKEYLNALSKIAPVFDLCHSGESLTKDRKDYRDPLHSSIDCNRRLIDKVWGEDGLTVSYWKDGSKLR